MSSSKISTDDMSETEPGFGHTTPWRVWLFRIVAVLVGLFFAINVTAAAQPWFPSAPGPPTTHPILERWSIPLAAGVDAAAALVMLYVAWRPRQAPLFLQYFALVIVIFILVTTPFEPALGIAVIAVLPVAVYPWPRQLLVPPWRDGVRWPLIGLAVLAGSALLGDAWIALQAQISRTDEVARTTAAYATNVEHLLAICVAMLFVASRRPSRGPLALMLGGELIYLGVVAISLPNATGSWGTIGGTISVLIGIVYLLDLAIEIRNRRRLA
jgi:hypothetical protein